MNRPIDIQIRVRINRLIDDAYRGYPAGIPKVTILRDAWSVVVTYRRNMGANDIPNVCAEHYLYARLRAIESIWGQVEQSIVIPMYPFKNLFGARASENRPSDYDPIHTEYEYLGLMDGIQDRRSLNDRISRL
jgi:hypothetical protein